MSQSAYLNPDSKVEPLAKCGIYVFPLFASSFYMRCKAASLGEVAAYRIGIRVVFMFRCIQVDDHLLRIACKHGSSLSDYRVMKR